MSAKILPRFGIGWKRVTLLLVGTGAILGTLAGPASAATEPGNTATGFVWDGGRGGVSGYVTDTRADGRCAYVLAKGGAVVASSCRTGGTIYFNNVAIDPEMPAAWVCSGWTATPQRSSRCSIAYNPWGAWWSR
jgi:hypothetical protein